ncbi:hypothetical protein GF380_01005 [Candidatus Uhrbacteria bacterium]|nr:hypothetical protein [Candidatus Uhrbacteria bacterium]MBD3283899.1 hypothetical protein [Candidatus Uhrbacteria bacterium]
MKNLLIPLVVFLIGAGCAAAPNTDSPSTNGAMESSGSMEPKAKNATASLNVCDLITAENIESATGFYPTSIEPSSSERMRGYGCMYKTDAAFEAVNIVVKVHDDESAAKMEYDGSKKYSGGDEARDLDGVGRAAFVSGTSYVFYAGNHSATIVMPFNRDVNQDEGAKLLADRLIEQL